MVETDEIRLLTRLLERVDHIVSEQAEIKEGQKDTNQLLQRTCAQVAGLDKQIAVNERTDQERWKAHAERHTRERTALGVVSAIFSAAGAGVAWFVDK